MSKPIPNMTDEEVQRFWAKVDQQSNGNCWNWTASIKQGVGYGQVGIGGQSAIFYAHRVAYKLHYGVDPGDQQVCHACDNRFYLQGGLI
jgi:hypothetical protein